VTGHELSRRRFLTGVGSLAVGFSLVPGVRARQAARAGAKPPSPGFRIAETSDADSLSWLVLTPAAITIHSGKVELGTGTQTALTQIVVEELHVDGRGVQYVQGDTRVTPDQGTTAGSKTIQNGGPQLRSAAATAFQALLGLAAQRLGVGQDELVADDGVFRDVHTGHRVTYQQLLAGTDLVLVADPNAPLASPDDYEIVGKPVQRADLPDKVSARFRYVHDVTVPGLVHGRVIRPSGRNATFVSIDPASLARAKAIPGFIQVVQQGNFVGVVGTTEWAAIQAADPDTGVVVNWDDGQPLIAQASLPQALRDPANQYASVEMVNVGDVEQGLASAAVTAQAGYFTPFQMHAAMGASCGVADVRTAPDRATGIQVTVWSGTQDVYALRGAVGSLLGVPADSVQVVYEEAAGCYGHNGADDACADAALLSQAVGRPVRVQWSRQDEHGWEPLGPAMAHDLRGGITDGKVVAWEHVLCSPTHNSRPNGNRGTLLAGALTGSLPAALPSAPGDTAGRNAPVTYTFPNNHLVGNLVRSFETTGATSGVPAAPLRYRFLRSTALRSLGGLSNTFANESFIDELAAAGGADPLQLRLSSLGDPRAVAVLEALTDTWAARPRGGNGVGAGIAFQQYETEFTYVAAYAEVAVDTGTGQVQVRRVVVAHDCGLVINPDGLRNQIEGNVVQGVSRALKEEVQFDERGVTSVVWEQSSFHPTPQYSVLRFSEVPEIEVILLDRTDQPAWGAGEPTIGIVPAAIGNAVFAAAGVRVRTLPMTPDRVLDAMRDG
jgi:CO/xanthine dehydrogenase Mo-binding subunit